jgi:tRNA (guanine-N7-)-methyltransferase
MLFLSSRAERSHRGHSRRAPATLRRRMARMRKAGRWWSREDARSAAERVLFDGDGTFFHVCPAELFRCRAPLEIELGAGRGDFIIERAAAMPERNFLAVELAASVARLMAVRVGRRGLDNLRVLRMDARTLVNLMLPDGSVAVCHIYFPDPWPKERHAKHRLFTPRFAAGLRRVLAPGGELYVVTDVEEYAQQIFTIVEAAGFSRGSETAAQAAATGFGRKFVLQGRSIFGAAFKRVNMSERP